MIYSLFARVISYNYLYSKQVKFQMNTKLTLTIEQAVIEKAKQYAKGKGRSLSDIVENYFKAITKEEDMEKVTSTPITDSLRGSFKAPKDFDYKEELKKALTDKYLTNG